MLKKTERLCLVCRLIISACKMPTYRTANHIELWWHSLSIEWSKVFSDINTEKKEIKSVEKLIDFAVKYKIIEPEIINSVKTIYS